MIDKRFLFGFTIAAALVILVGWVSYFTLSKQESLQVWVEHTYKVLNQVGAIERTVVQMETGRRGFRCTDDKAFLEPYYVSQPKLAPSIAKLRELLSDNAQQVVRAAKLDNDVHRIDSLWRNVNIMKVLTSEEKIQITHAEKEMMDAINGDLQEIGTAENILLVVRQKESKEAISQASRTIVIGTALILLIVFALIVLIFMENRSRVKAELALKDKLEELHKTNLATQEYNWLLTGLREINASLIGNDNLKELMGNCLASIVKYLKVPAAAFYFYNKEQGELQLMKSVALPIGVKEKIKLNEGITGSAAVKKEVTIVKNLPEGYWKIESAVGALPPDSIIFVPLWNNKELVGVIELGCFEQNTAEYVNLLKEISDNIAIGVYGAHSKDLSTLLLYKVQEQKEELENQQEELRQTNEELTHQAEVLRASEEELKTQEEELRQINEELVEKTEAVELAKESLQVKANELEINSKYKSEFLANMSHELRTPLNSVLILANLLKENKLSNLTPKQTEYARIIHKSGSDLLNLINDILDLSKIEAGKIDFQFEDVKIREIGYDMEQLFGMLAAEKKIDFTTKYAADVPEMLYTDKQRLEQVIKNLLSNAFKFTHEGGKVTLDFGLSAGRLSISVLDNGIGIAPEKQKLIFEAFQQADGSTSRRYGGTGLGLSISKELVSRLYGELNLSSRAGEGSTFTVQLPLAKTAPAILAADGSSSGTAIPDYDLSRIKEQTVIRDNRQEIQVGEQSILLIEDDVVFAGIVNGYAHEKGFKTIIAVSGDEGLYYARKYKPTAIILDLGLPVIDGRSVLKIIKADPELKNIPVHVISAEDKTDIASADIESYSRKPLLKNELEVTFTNIEGYIKEHYRDILVVNAAGTDLHKVLGILTTEINTGIIYNMAANTAEAIDLLKRKKADCIIADVAQDAEGGIKMLQQLKNAADPGTYIIAYLETDITSAIEKQLTLYSDSIIRKSAQDKSRLLDEVELFLHRINNKRKGPATPQKYQHAADKSLSGKKVLLADDDMRNVFALTALLEEEGMVVVSAENGKEALELLDQHPDTDIVLMDIMMPEMDGYEAMKYIRGDRKQVKLPVIALTAKAMTGDREKCIEAGASDYITKPIDNNKLFSLMRVWLS